MDAKLIVDEQDMRTLPMSWYGSKGGQRKIEEKLKVAVSSQWDSPRLMYNCRGCLFNLSIVRSRAQRNSRVHRDNRQLGIIVFDEKDIAVNLFSFHLWNSAGLVGLGSEMFLQDPEMPVPDGVLSVIRELCNLYLKNQIHCSGCGELIGRDDVAGSYFAGRYCESCWESKYRAIKARESYS